MNLEFLKILSSIIFHENLEIIKLIFLVPSFFMLIYIIVDMFNKLNIFKVIMFIVVAFIFSLSVYSFKIEFDVINNLKKMELNKQECELLLNYAYTHNSLTLYKIYFEKCK